MNHENILRKIQKCLALSKSANEHEASVALRQAQKLMELHNVSEEGLLLADVTSDGAPSVSTRNPRAGSWNLRT